MADAIDVNYVINAKNDIFDIYGIGHMSWMNIAILVSKKTSGPQDCSKMSFNNILEV